MEFFTWKFVLVWSRVNKVKDARSNAGKGKTNMSCVGCGVWTKIDEHYSNGDGLGGWKLGPKCGMGGWIFRGKKKEPKKNMMDAICWKGLGEVWW